ncbi:hypothetical protein EV363DRAFT_1182648 [Boletus edulis]|nr:hypothetical protein EV363DRAFT_1182648 [Boletus edulis]
MFTGSCVLGGINVSSNCRLACTEVLCGIQIQGELADIAQAIGLVASGAKVVQRKLVSMLEDYKSGCASVQLLDVNEVVCRCE